MITYSPFSELFTTMWTTSLISSPFLPLVNLEKKMKDNNNNKMREFFTNPMKR